MSYKWRLSKSAKREFANKMSTDPQFAADYYARKNAKAEKRRSSSQFDYATAGGNYTPTREQYDAAITYLQSNTLTPQQRDACNQVIYGYTCREKVHHDYIHLVNELRRQSI